MGSSRAASKTSAGDQMRDFKIKHLLLLSSALGAGLGGTTSLIAPVHASCTSYTPADGTTVTCSGSSTTSIAAQKDVTINFLDGAQHTTAGSGARITENSEINLYGNAAVTAGGAGLTISEQRKRQDRLHDHAERHKLRHERSINCSDIY